MTEPFGPASKFLLNYDYYEVMGKALSMSFEEQHDKALIPGGNFEPDRIEERQGDAMLARLGRSTGFLVEKTDDGEVVTFEVGLTPQEKAEISGAGSWEATEVEIVDWGE